METTASDTWDGGNLYPDDYQPPETEPIDYSLNDFEALVKGAYTGSKKEKAVILRAIEDYKTMTDRM